MDVKLLEYLLVIEQEGTISKAAERIHISQSALSQNLSKIESELGLPLFERRSRLLVPTAAGARYLEGAKEMIQIKEETYEKIQNLTRHETNVLRITICPQVHSVYGNRLIKNLKNTIEHYHLEFHAAESPAAKNYLINNLTDAAILCITNRTSSLLQCYPLYKEHLVLAVPAEMAWEGDGLVLSEFKKCPLVLASKECFLRSAADSLLGILHYSPQKTYESANIDDIKMLADHGYGAAFLPSSMTHSLDSCRLYPCPDADSYEVVFACSKYTKKLQPIMELYHTLCQLLP